MDIDGQDANEGFICTICAIKFLNYDEYLLHYQTPWHQFNCIQKSANLSAKSFDEFLQLRKDEENKTKAELKEEKRLFCRLCRKEFKCDAAFANHCQSKRHLQNEEEYKKREKSTSKKKPKQEKPSVVNIPAIVEKESVVNIPAIVEKESVVNIPAIVEKESVVSIPAIVEEDSEIEEVDSDEWANEDISIPAEGCLFCDKVADSIVNNLTHMSQEHSFFIPRLEYCIDVKGLLECLGEKVGSFFECLWCGSYRFNSLEAVRDHMMDSSHNAVNWDEDIVLREFYDYSDLEDDDDDALIMTADQSELRLSNGNWLAHRYLARYRRSSEANSALVAVRKKRQSLALVGRGPKTVAEKKTAHRDVNVCESKRMKHFMQLGIKGSKLFKVKYSYQYR